MSAAAIASSGAPVKCTAREAYCGENMGVGDRMLARRMSGEMRIVSGRRIALLPIGNMPSIWPEHEMTLDVARALSASCAS